MAALSGVGRMEFCRDGEAETLLALLVSQQWEDPGPETSKGLEEPLTRGWGDGERFGGGSREGLLGV